MSVGSSPSPLIGEAAGVGTFETHHVLTVSATERT